MLQMQAWRGGAVWTGAADHRSSDHLRFFASLKNLAHHLGTDDDLLRVQVIYRLIAKVPEQKARDTPEKISLHEKGLL